MLHSTEDSTSVVPTLVPTVSPYFKNVDSNGIFTQSLIIFHSVWFLLLGVFFLSQLL